MTNTNTRCDKCKYKHKHKFQYKYKVPLALSWDDAYIHNCNITCHIGQNSSSNKQCNGLVWFESSFGQFWTAVWCIRWLSFQNVCKLDDTGLVTSEVQWSATLALTLGSLQSTLCNIQPTNNFDIKCNIWLNIQWKPSARRHCRQPSIWIAIWLRLNCNTSNELQEY